MQHFPQSVDLLPTWSAGTEQRLWLSMSFATVVLLLAISWLQMPSPRESTPLTQLIVDLVRTAQEAPVETPVEPVPEPLVEEPVTVSELIETPVMPEDVPDDSVEAGVAEEAAQQTNTDWAAASLAAVQNVLDENSKTYSVNPVFDEKRRQAGETFRPSEAPVKKEIWDNVSKDYLGRTIWRNGGCYKILDNPSAVYRWVFETFERYMTYCDGSMEEYLIEIDKIPGRYDYLEEEFGTGIP